MRYLLGRDALKQPFNVNQLIEINTLINCGPIHIEFIDENDKVLSPDIFAVEANLDSEELQNFMVIKQRDSRSAGEYLIRYRASLRDYTSVEAVQLEEPFKVTIVEVNQSDYIFNIEPDWLGELEDQQVQVGDSFIYQLGEKTNMFGQEV